MSWKLFTIILLIILIGENIFLGVTLKEAYHDIQREEKCEDLCYYSEDADSYIYEDFSRICYCMKEREVILEEYIE